MHIDYGVVEYLRRDAESIVDSQSWVEEHTSGADASIEVRDGGYSLATGGDEKSSAALRLPAFLDLSVERHDIVAVEVDVQSTTEPVGQYTLGLHGEDGGTRIEWRSARTDPLVIVDGDATVATAPGRELNHSNRHVHRLEFDQRQQLVRHYVDGCRSSEISDESVLPGAGTFGGAFVASGTDGDPTETTVRRISHVAGQRRGPE